MPAPSRASTSLASAALALLLAAPAAAVGTSFAGHWETTFGDMALSTSSGRAEGYYLYAGTACPIVGTVEGSTFSFTYRDSFGSGEGSFELAADGESFFGRWRNYGEQQWRPWAGRRLRGPRAPPGFDGLWETSFGRLRLSVSDGRAHGFYAYGAGGTVEGRVEGRVLELRYTEPAVAGEARFELSNDGSSFLGRWRPDGAKDWGEWKGVRVEPVPGVVWLVVLEAPWSQDLADREYAYGEMLRAFFLRDPRVQVRRREFTDGASLKRWIRESALLAEPVVLYLSTHGAEDGIPSLSGALIGAPELAEALRFAGNVKLLHFGACLMMKGTLPNDLLRSLPPGVRFPISGFAETVDWAASAVGDFMYMDLVLARGLEPADAARQLRDLIPFAVKPTPKTAPFGTLGFRLVTP
ncbi:MAG: hypothetical protein HY553_17385 [Elusimicrobia bacterium]|nr:hypothetical protein [Elusimicrobiota bacterium]